MRKAYPLLAEHAVEHDTFVRPKLFHEKVHVRIDVERLGRNVDRADDVATTKILEDGDAARNATTFASAEAHIFLRGRISVFAISNEPRSAHCLSRPRSACHLCDRYVVARQNESAQLEALSPPRRARARWRTSSNVPPAPARPSTILVSEVPWRARAKRTSGKMRKRVGASLTFSGQEGRCSETLEPKRAISTLRARAIGKDKGKRFGEEDVEGRDDGEVLVSRCSSTR